MILETIRGPEDLRKLSVNDLDMLCTEMRDLIIDVVSKNGGHLAPSLGVVELATALHYVFDSPRDKIIWDVGHQSYAHMILTGRREQFSTLRTLGGISGFPKIHDNEHDAFGTGHSSTSISAALGIAHVLKRQGGDHRAIAVIGDGSMMGGLSFEALNHAGHDANNLIVVLNDNEMSISPSVGALSRFFSVRIHSSRARRLRYKLKKLISYIPIWGMQLSGLAQRAEEATVSFLTPGFLFEAFGFDYIGPLDGHDLGKLARVFEDVRDAPMRYKPLLIHVLTQKGKGYEPAEKNPTKYHGVGSFDRVTGKTAGSKKRTYTNAFGDALLEVAERQPKVLAITAAMATGTGLSAFAERHPDSFFDVGMAEGHAVTFAAGLATQGYRPVVAIYSTFLQRAYDHIIHDVCLQNLPVTFALDRAGLVGDDGPTHHGAFDLSYLRPFPNLTIAVPRDEHLMREILFFATSYDGPVALRYPRGAIPEYAVAMQPEELLLGRAEVLRWNGNPDVVMWAVGHSVFDALDAAANLEASGINAAVVDPRFIKPFDVALFKELCGKCQNLITVEENALSGGFGSMIGEIIASEGLHDVRLTCLGIADSFVEHGTQSELRNQCGIDAQGIAKTAIALIEGVDGKGAHRGRRLSPSPSRGEGRGEGDPLS